MLAWVMVVAVAVSLLKRVLLLGVSVAVVVTAKMLIAKCAERASECE